MKEKFCIERPILPITGPSVGKVDPASGKKARRGKGGVAQHGSVEEVRER